MPSDSFMSELSQMSPDEWVETGAQYLISAIVPENRATVFEVFNRRIWETVFPEDPDEEPILMSLEEFLAQVEDGPPPLVSDFLPSKKLICLSGTAKEGKSLVALQILQDICIGKTIRYIQSNKRRRTTCTTTRYSS